MSGSARGYFNWGRGCIVRAAATFFVLFFLMANLLSLILSVSPVVENTPGSYSSSIHGEVSLPYYPSPWDDILIDAPGEVVRGEPFTITAEYPCGRIPHVPQRAVLTLGNHTRSWPLGGYWQRDRASWTGSARIPGLDKTGSWRISLHNVLVDNDGEWILSEELAESNIESVSDPDRLELLLQIGEDLSVGDDMVFSEAGGKDPEIWSASISIDGGDRIELLDRPGERLMVAPNSSMSPGWHWLNLSLRRNDGVHDVQFRDYLVWRSIPEEMEVQVPGLTFTRLLNGHDDLFEQASEKAQGPDDGVVTLFGGDIYRLDLEFDTDARGDVSTIPDSLRDCVPHPVYWIDMEEGLYLMAPTPDPSTLSGTLIVEEGVNKVKMDLKTGWGADWRTIETFEPGIKTDYMPSFFLDPDPFRWDLEKRGAGIDFVLHTLREYTRPPRFVSEPEVSLDHTSIVMDERDGYEGIVWEGELDDRQALTGAILRIKGEVEYIYTTNMLIILPIPPFVYGMPPDISGWGAVIWFGITSVIIAWAAGAYLSRGRIRKTGKRRSDDIGGGPPLRFLVGRSVTSSTFIAALFFSIAVNVLFRLVEQPTPVPGSLSDEVPIWIRMIGLAQASVWEEVSGRILLIGLPLLLIRGIGKHGSGRWGHLIGGSGHFGVAEVVLILVSSSIFGLAHLGWGPWKVIPTFVTGLLFGYLFIRVGLHACIIMHFLFDYIGFLFELTGLGILMTLLLLLFAMLFGGLLMAPLISGAFRWTAERFGFGKPPPWIYLAIHSTISFAMGLYMVTGSGTWAQRAVGVLFLLVPLLEGGALAVHKIGSGISRDSGMAPASKVLRGLSKWGVYFISLPTLALAPIGMAWIVDEEDPGA